MLTVEERRAPSTRAGHILTLLKSVTRTSDRDIAEAVGVTRATVLHKRSGYTAWDLVDVALFARAFNVPEWVFLAAEDDWWAWYTDNRDLVELRPVRSDPKG